MQLTNEILQYIDAHADEALGLLLELAVIPAPSNHEEQRAAFCRNWLEKQGAQGVYIDEALNVVWPLGDDGVCPLVVYMAHSDVVFPDTTPLPLTVEADRICCPGIGDDTANVAALLLAAKYLAETSLQPRETGVLLVINAGEEGLGNLKGSRKIMQTYGSRVREFVSLDGGYSYGADRAVGSHRYRIAVDTEGGHSYGAFGNRNAIAYLASMIDALYTMKVPPMGRTTYNVGTISGGTSVNTIAQHAEMLYEYRSDDREALELMRQHLAAAVEFYRAKGVQVTVELVGDRPCGGDVPADRQAALNARVSAAVLAHYGVEPQFGPSSTDCNIPLSLGVPAVCIGCYAGHGAHTREEYLLTNSLHPGRRLAFELILAHF